ncbi:hypothetical protein KDL01_33055 [Actinospica durhamensis]|uniref:PKD domain-containing protein n=1 Tax=Actinospica durhamensis TaxID=1508375 RepID=A0A941EVQ3_9ACTN|nr:hypothetical protein [Actinospica durhamensis]MBR7838148.1 hypothetical protein [Actinospica durhamensis]
MRSRRLAASAALLIALGSAAALPAQSADAASATTLLVDIMSPYCSDTSATAGSTATPYCTIQAAANAATAGTTVEIFGGAGNAVEYPEEVTITHSGTATAPITFEAIGRFADIGSINRAGTVTVKNASYVDLLDLAATTIDVVSSSHVDVSRSDIENLTVESSSSAVSAERNSVETVTVASGAANTDITANVIRTSLASSGVTVNGATGTDITNNTIDMLSAAKPIAVTGSASGTSIENNLLSGASDGTPEITVDASSAPGTTEKYNVLALDAVTNVPYSWAGAAYTTLAAFQTATGQGSQDVLEDFDTSVSDSLLTSANPAFGTADASAPGRGATDFYGNAWTGDDRGAMDFAQYTGASVVAVVDEQSVLLNVDLKGLLIGSGSSVSLNWGDGSTNQVGYELGSSDIFTDFSDIAGGHQYTSVGTYTITATVVDESATKTFTTQVTTQGATYVPVTPARVLDTRHGTGAATGMVTGGHSVAFSVASGVSGAPAASAIAAVVLNVTVVSPAKNGFVTAYPDGAALPTSSNLNYSTGQTVPNLTTVMVGQDGKVDLYTSATAYLVADVEGYYVTGSAGGGYHPLSSPDRLLDTRHGTGTAAKAVAPGGTISLQVAGNGSIPSNATSAAMNVTVVSGTANGFVTAFPSGGTTPNSSNVNYRTGQTVANMAIVKVGSDGKIEFTNSSTGTVQIIADMAGYYTAAGGDAFIPMKPWRALDTRNGTGQESSLTYPVAADSPPVWWFDDEFDGTGYWDGGPGQVAALVLNVTVVSPAANGLLVAYSGVSSSVPTASNINFLKGQTIPSMVMVACNPRSDQPALYNESKGTTQLVADVFGYFS